MQVLQTQGRGSSPNLSQCPSSWTGFTCWKTKGIPSNMSLFTFISYDLSGVSISPEWRADDMWVEISNLKDKSTSEQKYVYLPKIMLVILSIPHSNAEDERIFSLVMKNSTEFRPSLATKTLSDLLTQKVMSLASEHSCYEMTFSDSLLAKYKGAATAFNK